MPSILIDLPDETPANMMRIFWRADAYEADVMTEDGLERTIEESAFLMAEDVDGRRWTGPTIADTATGGSLKRRGSVARKAVATCLRAYAEAVREGEFDPRNAWHEGRPCYGSPAYVMTGGDEEWQDD